MASPMVSARWQKGPPINRQPTDHVGVAAESAHALTSVYVKGSRMSAAQERDRLHERQAFEKPQGRKPRAGSGTAVPRVRSIYGDLMSLQRLGVVTAARSRDEARA